MKMYSFKIRGNLKSTDQPLYHLKRKMPDGKKIQITGYWKGISEGDILQFQTSRENSNDGCDYYKIENIKYRDHQGNFQNPENKSNSFFDTTCSLIVDDRNIISTVTHINGEENNLYGQK